MLNFSNTLTSPMGKAYFFEFLSFSHHPLVANLVISYDKAIRYGIFPISPFLLGATKKTISFAKKQISTGSKNDKVINFSKKFCQKPRESTLFFALPRPL